MPMPPNSVEPRGAAGKWLLARGWSWWSCWLCLLCCALADSRAQTAPPAAAQPLSDTLQQRIAACSACHASKQRNDAFFPRIAGKPAGYLYNQLINFRDGRRHYPVMVHMVEHLPDSYLREIATYFSQQHPVPAAPLPANAGVAALERGRILATAGDTTLGVPACSACHGAQLGGVAPAIPGLLGLSRDYINAQFGAWKNHQRQALPPDCMAQVANRLSAADIAAVSSWLAGQQAAPQARPASSMPTLPLPLQCGSALDAGAHPPAPTGSAPP